MANTYFNIDPKTGVATIDLFTNAHGVLAEPDYRLYLGFYRWEECGDTNKYLSCKLKATIERTNTQTTALTEEIFYWLQRINIYFDNKLILGQANFQKELSTRYVAEADISSLCSSANQGYSNGPQNFDNLYVNFNNSPYMVSPQYCSMYVPYVIPYASPVFNYHQEYEIKNNAVNNESFSLTVDSHIKNRLELQKQHDTGHGWENVDTLYYNEAYGNQSGTVTYPTEAIKSDVKFLWKIKNTEMPIYTPTCPTIQISSTEAIEWPWFTYTTFNGNYWYKTNSYYEKTSYIAADDSKEFINEVKFTYTNPFTITNPSLILAKLSGGTFPVMINTERMKIGTSFDFSYKDVNISQTTNFEISVVLKDTTNNEQFYKQTIAMKANGASSTKQLYSSPVAGRGRSVHLILEISEVSYGRKTTVDLGDLIIYSYQPPEIKYWDIYRSNPQKHQDNQSTKIAGLADWEYSTLDGNNSTIATIKQYNAAGTSLIATSSLHPSANVSFYDPNLTYAVGTDYIVRLTVTDTFGSTTSRDFLLSSTPVLMEFRNGGYGLAIGKSSEVDAFEVALPTVFYDTVTFINGGRQTNDAANSLGFQDTYNTGCRTIQEILDYIIAKIK